MKNKNILYLITLIITFFSFSLNAQAAQELTCVYKKPSRTDVDSTYKMILIQYENGGRVVYSHVSDTSIKSFGWEKLANYKINIDDVPEDKKDTDGHLTECPAYGNLHDGKNYAIFRDTSKLGYEKLENEKSEKAVKEPTYVEVATVDTTIEGWYSSIDGSSKYTGSCKYKKTLENGGVHTIVMNFGNEHISFTEYDPEKGGYSGLEESRFETIDANGNRKAYNYFFWVAEEFNAEYLLEKYGGDCPAYIKVDRNKIETMESVGIGTTILASSKSGVTYYIDDDDAVRGKNPVTGEVLTWAGKYNPTISTTTIESCEELFGEEIVGYLNIIWKIIKIGIPILLIGLGTIDFAQAVFSGKEDDMKKVQGKFIKRIIIAVVIFIIPTVFGLVLKIADGIWGNVGSDLCGLLF